MMTKPKCSKCINSKVALVKKATSHEAAICEVKALPEETIVNEMEK
jgi:hypothetical protein